MSSLESFIVLTWLSFVQRGLPKLVRQSYGIEQDIPEEYPTPVVNSKIVSVRQSPLIPKQSLHLFWPWTQEPQEIRASTARITPSSPQQTDGSSLLSLNGDTRLQLIGDNLVFNFESLLFENLDVKSLAAISFMESNDISIRQSKCFN